MAEDNTIVQETAAAPAEPEAIASPAGNVPEAAPIEPDAPPDENLDALLSEYDQATAGPGVDEILAPDTGGQQDHQAIADAFRNQDELAQLRHGEWRAARRADILEQALAEHRHVEWLRAENKAFDELVAQTDRELKEFNLPPDFSRDWFLSRSLRDPALRAAWDNRAINPRAWDTVQRQCSVALWKLASSRPDPELTADRWAVVQAVRQSSRVMPAEPEPDLSQLDNASYRKHVKSRFGFDPGV